MDEAAARKIEEMLQACAKHALERHPKPFNEMGFTDPAQLKAALEDAIKQASVRSFERQPDPARDQIEPSFVYQVQLEDQAKKLHQVTVILNPDRDEHGRVHGGTAIPNDPKRRLEIGHLINRDVKERGIVPTLSLRGPELIVGEEQAIKSPMSRLQPFTEALDRKADVVREADDPQPLAKRETFMERMQRLNPFTEEQLAEHRRKRELDAERLLEEQKRGRVLQRSWEPDKKD